MEEMRGTLESNQDPDGQSYSTTAQRAMQHSASHTPTTLLSSGGEQNVPGDVGPMEVPDSEYPPMSPDTLQQHVHDLGPHPLDTHDVRTVIDALQQHVHHLGTNPLDTFDARTVLARAVLALCNDEPPARTVTGQPTPDEEPSIQGPVVNEHHSYMPAPLPPPVVEYYDTGDAEPVEVPDIPRAVPPHAGDWWYFPAAVLVAAAVDWQGRPFIIWRRPTADLIATTPVYRAYYRVPHDLEPPLREDLPPSAYQPETASTSDVPQAQGPPNVHGQTGPSPPLLSTFDELAAGWGQGAHADGFIQEALPREELLPPVMDAPGFISSANQDVEGRRGVTRTVEFDVKLEEAEVDGLLGIEFRQPA